MWGFLAIFLECCSISVYLEVFLKHSRHENQWLTVVLCCHHMSKMCTTLKFCKRVFSCGDVPRCASCVHHDKIFSIQRTFCEHLSLSLFFFNTIWHEDRKSRLHKLTSMQFSGYKIKKKNHLRVSEFLLMFLLMQSIKKWQ